MNAVAEEYRELDVDFPDWFEPLWMPARYKIARGGRGSGKSTTFARALIALSAERPLRILCGRELQNSIQDSVHQLISDQIEDMCLLHEFTIREKGITSRAGSEFMFKGVRGTRGDASQLKSLEGVDICWLEEGQTISKASLETITPTIRKPGSEIWISYNPDQEADPVHQLAENPPDGSIVVDVNWYDNPWFPETLDLERRWMQRTDPDAYAHVWDGKCRQYTDAQVLRGKWVIESFDPGEDWSGPYYGSDFGYAKDPTTLSRCWIHDAKLYIEHEAWAVGCEIDETPALYDTVPGSRDHTIRADSSRPETISYLRRSGFKIVGAKKGKGSVEDGVAHLRGYEQIVIHPRCTHTADEARLWSWQVDRISGDVLPKLRPGNDHIFDGIRYALEPVIRRGRGGNQYASVISRTIG